MGDWAKPGREQVGRGRWYYTTGHARGGRDPPFPSPKLLTLLPYISIDRTLLNTISSFLVFAGEEKVPPHPIYPHCAASCSGERQRRRAGGKRFAGVGPSSPSISHLRSWEAASAVASLAAAAAVREKGGSFTAVVVVAEVGEGGRNSLQSSSVEEREGKWDCQCLREDLAAKRNPPFLPVAWPGSVTALSPSLPFLSLSPFELYAQGSPAERSHHHALVVEGEGGGSLYSLPGLEGTSLSPPPSPPKRACAPRMKGPRERRERERTPRRLPFVSPISLPLASSASASSSFPLTAFGFFRGGGVELWGPPPPSFFRPPFPWLCPAGRLVEAIYGGKGERGERGGGTEAASVMAQHLSFFFLPMPPLSFFISPVYAKGSV